MQVGYEFTMNGGSWKLLERFENWGFFEGKLVFVSSTKPSIIWDCGTIKTDPQGGEIAPNSLGVENSLLNRDKKEIHARYLRGIEKLETDKDRAKNTLQEKRDIQEAEQKRLDFLAGMEEKKRHLLEELQGLYEKSEKPEGITSNKRAMEILHQISAFDTFRFYYRQTIYKL